MFGTDTASYAMSGTDIGYGTVCLRACYAMSGTDIACVGSRRTGTLPCQLRLLLPHIGASILLKRVPRGYQEGVKRMLTQRYLARTFYLAGGTQRVTKGDPAGGT
eukprot:1613607-Rhodomonas_salina.2